VYCSRLLILAVALLIAACSASRNVSPPRYAVLRFENLTPDASLNWVGRAASEILIREIGAISSTSIYAANEHFGRRPVSSPGVSTEFADALLAGANRIITGYFELDKGTLHFHLVEEDARTGKRVRQLSAKGPIFDACESLARQITTPPKVYPTRNEAALRSYIQGMETNGGSASLNEAAIAADPHFSDAYLAAGELAMAHKDAEGVSRVLEQAQAQKIDPRIIAKLQFAEATALNDTDARTAALRRMVETDPSNITDIQALGEALMEEHRFSEAAAVFGKGASNERPDLLNLKAYALMFGGDEKGALESIHEYQKARPRDANGQDSEGDIHFFFGQFPDAEKAYLSAGAKDPQFNQGMEVWKAARARLMTGDMPGATALFARYRAEHEKAKDPTVPVRAADWQFLTGDRQGALAAMHQIGGDTSNDAIRHVALAQAAIWELQMGRKTDAARDADAVIKAGQTSSLVAAAIAHFATVEPASVAELQARAERSFNGPASEHVRQLAIGYSLIFARRYADAVPVWKTLYEKSNPNDADPRALYAISLERSGRSSEAAPLLKNNLPPGTALAPSFECLYFNPGNTAAQAK
jgi:Flp pilus assembly protein TadD